MSSISIRNLSTVRGIQAGLALEREIWGYTDPCDHGAAGVFIITVKRGAILIGAFDERDRMIGFAYSLVGMKDGKAMQWSHMTGVLPEYRGGLGLPAEAGAAGARAGARLRPDRVDVRSAAGDERAPELRQAGRAWPTSTRATSTASRRSALHRGTPTDRLVVQWHIAEPHVARRLEQRAGAADPSAGRRPTRRWSTAPRWRAPGARARAST